MITRAHAAVAVALLSSLAALPPSSFAREVDDAASKAEGKALMAHVQEMKMMSADSAQTDAMTKEMAKMMVMDHMAEMLAHDPSMMSTVQDPNVMKLHDNAKQMAENPTQMQQMETEIMADPMEMEMVMHDATKMPIAQGQMGAMTDSKMDSPAK